MKNRILLVCYSFPPHPGIGGRRWAKFSKYLLKEGYQIDVFNAFNYSDQTSLWSSDVENEKNINVYSFKFFLQRLLLKPAGLFDKLIRKVLISLIKLTPYNESIITSFPNKKFWMNVQNALIKNDYDELIVTGDPFLFYYASLLKRQNGCKLILDYRDLWNDHSFYRKNVSLSFKQREFFEKAENYAVNNCDKIIFVDPYLKEVISKRIKNDLTRLKVIHNGFDIDDFKGLAVKIESEKIKIFFAGNISSDLNSIVGNFLNSYVDYYKSGRSNFEIYFYGKYDQFVVDKIKSMETIGVTHKDTLPYNEYLNKLNNSDIGIIILSEEYANSYTTKYSDYIALNKFILCLGYKGEFSQYIESKEIGLRFNPEMGTDFFDDLKFKYSRRNRLSEDEKSKFELGNITNELVGFLKN